MVHDGDLLVQGLVKCMGGVALSGIFDRLSKLMRFTMGGVPDLVVWNPDTCRFKVRDKINIVFNYLKQLLRNSMI